MPQLARHDKDLLDETGRHLSAAEGLIATPSLSSLVEAQGRIDTAVSVLSDALVVTDKHWVRAQGRCASVLVEWEKACRISGVRGELLTMLAAGAKPADAPRMWLIEGFGDQPVGDIALVAFSAACNIRI